MTTAVPSIRECKLCGNPRQARNVITDGKTVELAICNICDKRRCSKDCDEIVQDPYARRCPKCNRNLFAVIA